MEAPRLVFEASAKLSWVPDEVESKSTIASPNKSRPSKGRFQLQSDPLPPQFPRSHRAHSGKRLTTLSARQNGRVRREEQEQQLVHGRCMDGG